MVVEDKGLVSSLWLSEEDVECGVGSNGDDKDNGGIFSVGKTRVVIGTDETFVRGTGRAKDEDSLG